MPNREASEALLGQAATVVDGTQGISYRGNATSGMNDAKTRVELV